MRIDFDTTHAVKIVLSERNVRDLVHALDSGQTYLTLTRSFGPDTKGVIVGVETDEVHYVDLPVDNYCKVHDIFDCWFNH